MFQPQQGQITFSAESRKRGKFQKFVILVINEKNFYGELDFTYRSATI